MSENMKKKLAIFAAGTGGHVYPGISIANQLIAENIDIIWIGAKLGIEKKLVEKNLDLIVANDVSDQSIGFDSDENEVTLITKLEKKKIKKTSKKNVSKKIVEFIAQKVIND